MVSLPHVSTSSIQPPRMPVAVSKPTNSMQDPGAPRVIDCWSTGSTNCIQAGNTRGGICGAAGYVFLPLPFSLLPFHHSPYNACPPFSLAFSFFAFHTIRWNWTNRTIMTELAPATPSAMQNQSCDWLLLIAGLHGRPGISEFSYI